MQLLTHLAYWGYCFNPVSFYYCLDASERSIETVVAEVRTVDVNSSSSSCRNIKSTNCIK